MESSSESETSGDRWKCCLGYFIGIVMGLVVLNALIYYTGLKIGIGLFGAICVFAVVTKGVSVCGGEPHTVAVQSEPITPVSRQQYQSSGGSRQYQSSVSGRKYSYVGGRQYNSSVVGRQYQSSDGGRQYRSSVGGQQFYESSVSSTSRNECTVPEVIVSSSDKDYDSDQVASIVSKHMSCSLHKAQTLIQMLKDGKTIPFLIRYRKNVVGNWSPRDMRNFKDVYQNAKNVVGRAAYVKRNVAASGQLNDHVRRAIDNARTLAELDDIFEPYKPAKTKSALSALRDLELNMAADQILNQQLVDIRNLLNSHHEHTKTREDVKALLLTSVTEAILRRMCDVPWKGNDWTIHSVKIPNGKVEDDKDNYRKYYDFNQPVKYLRADEALAMNRGAKKNILKVTLTPGNTLKAEIQQTMNKMFGFKSTHTENDVSGVLSGAITAAQNKLIIKMSRKVHKDITKSAEDTAIEVFSSNLKRLLLTPPYRKDHEFRVLGIDPGMRHGCKSVIVNSKSLTVMNHFIIHLFPIKGPRDYPHDFEQTLKDILRKWRVEIIVVGNGVGCQDVEKVVNNIILLPEFSGVRYTVIPEQGVSVYSVSEEAEQEYPGFTPEIISSLSLVKRFINPLHEYVKVDPKHLGIGMYQHDINKKKLTDALQETVSEIVSIVGVDLNTASLPLLKCISGLTASRANAIIDHRNRRGAFKNRNELLQVEGIDYATFEQCAGFVRIIPPSNVANRFEHNPLDQTIIHPEDYSATHTLLWLMGLSINNIGTPEFIKRVNNFTAREDFVKVSEKLGVDVDTTKLLMHALSMSLNPDIRSLAVPPDLKTRIFTIDELQLGMIVSGRVENVTTFGAFVDIGVGVSALLYFKTNSKPDIGLGDRIEAQIDNLEVNRERIGLKFKRKISDLFPMNNLI